MASHRDLSDRLMEIIIDSPDCVLEDIVLKCPDLTWNQVFLALDRLSREGQVFLNQKGAGLYTVTPCTHIIATKAAAHNR